MAKAIPTDHASRLRKISHHFQLWHLIDNTKAIFLILLGLIVPAIANAAHLHPEKYYQNKWCAEHHGQAEVELPDHTRADCITSINAIEFDFAHKW